MNKVSIFLLLLIPSLQSHAQERDTATRKLIELNAVQVTAPKEAFRIEPDKKIFNVSSALASKGGTIAEVFRQVPGVTVTPAGKLTLRNGTPTLLIDGKRTNLTLEQIPADQVASIEVITNPSARYDAAGSSGIINIITKKNRKRGVNGSVNANWSTIPEYNVYGDLNISRKQFRLNLNYLQHGHRGEYDQTLVRDSTLRQQGHSVTQGPFRKGKFSLDWLPDNNNTFTLSGDMGAGDFKTRNQQTVNDNHRLTRTNDNFRFSHIAMDYAHQFKRTDERLTSSFSLEKFNGPNSGTYNMQYANYQVLQQYDGGIRAHTIVFNTDYKIGKFETGIKATWHKDHNQNRMEDYDSISGKYIINKAATYNFRYDDPTYAAYANYAGSYGKFSYMAGLRFEQYNYHGYMIDSNVNINYHNPGLYPSIFLTQELAENTELHLNYSRRVNRPGWDEISPFTDYSNAQNLYRGNPQLQSAFTNLFEFSYNTMVKKISIVSTLYFRNTNKAITSYTTALTPDTLLTTYINARYNNTYGVELVFKSPITKWWDVSVNANLFDTHISTGDKGFSWFAKLNSHTRLPKEITLELTGNYEAPKILPQGKSLSTGSVDMAMGKTFLKKKNATITLSVTDIFNTQKDRTRTMLAGQFSQFDTQKYLTRVFKINLNYQFGAKEK